MARVLADSLRRFKPAVAPGAAGPPGTPIDQAEEAAAELAAVFAALEPVHVAAGRVRAEARADAERRRRQGMEEAERILAGARARRDAVRAEAASRQLAALDEARATIDAGAKAEAERVRQVAEQRLPGIVARVVDGVWETAGLPATTAATAPVEAAG